LQESIFVISMIAFLPISLPISLSISVSISLPISLPRLIADLDNTFGHAGATSAEDVSIDLLAASVRRLEEMAAAATMPTAG
jgi:hypothetical protein